MTNVSQVAGGDSPSISRDTIIHASLEYIDAHGLEKFSMRGVARQLGLAPAAVHYWVKDKSALFAELSAYLLAQVEVPDRHLPWDFFVARLAANYRTVTHNNPRAAPLLNVSIVGNTELEFPFAESLLRALHDGGFRGQGLIDAYNTVIGCLFGFVGLEMAPAPENAKEWEGRRQQVLSNVDDNDFPFIARNRPLLERGSFVIRWQSGIDLPLDQAFHASVDTVIRGLRSRLADSPAPDWETGQNDV
jgi:TetR/AcrR family transcriptional regulator, tetracycline repressor protein